MSHSPGPWKWRTEAHSINCLAAADGYTVATYDRSHYPGENPHDADDRALLAAAPEMLTLLREVEWDGTGRCPSCTDVDKHASACRLNALLDRLGRQ